MCPCSGVASSNYVGYIGSPPTHVKHTTTTTKVVAIHKGGSTQELNNFRPISLLSIFDKIIEKLMHKRVYEFLEDHNILYELQFGFRKKMSTGHSLVEITEEIKESIDNGKFGCGIFII